MSQEKFEQHSKNWGASEEAFAMISEITVLPIEIWSIIAAQAFEGFAD